VKAVGVAADGALTWADAPEPAPPGPGEILVDVVATAVNRADLLQRAGRYPAPPGASPILGLEASGVVRVAGPKSGFVEGDRVAVLLAGGGYAERVTCPAGHALRLPDTMSFTDAAALPEAVTTVVVNLVGEAALAPGERVYLPAGASGIGTMAVQLCRIWGNPTWVSCGSPEKVARCVALGAAGGTVRAAASSGRWEALIEDLRTFSGGRGVDVVLDPVTGDALPDALASLAVGGRLVVIGVMAGRYAKIDLARLMVSRQRVIGSVLRSRSDAEKTKWVQWISGNVWPAFADGSARALVDVVLPISEVAAAHQRMQDDLNVGKIVLTLPGR
jgi:putative PIG3 family NAD(P)H quinone oxidoreductase